MRTPIRPLMLFAAIAAAGALLACAGDDDAVPTFSAGSGSGDIDLTSDAFFDGGVIPEEFTCDGADLSPPLQWDGIPDDTASLALIMDDLDANFVHWVAYDMDPALSGIDSVGNTETLPDDGGDNGKNSFGDSGYGGPCPPSGQNHTYQFTLYALDAPADLDPGATASQLGLVIEGHIIATGVLTGTYSR